MPTIENLDFLNLNSIRNYPIKDGVSRISVNAAFEIPNDFLVDAQIAATYDPTRRFYISKISNLVSSIVIEVSDNFGVVAGLFTIISNTHTAYKEYFLTPSSNYVGATGLIVVFSLDSILAAPTGVFVFDPATTEFEARTIIPALQGINRLIFQNADGSTIPLTGDVHIVARTNLQFKKVVDQNVVILDAGDGLGLNKHCTDPLPCIKTINGIPPDETGNFTLDFADCASWTPIPAGTGLVLQDICCKPCMGCNDIGELTTRLTEVESALLSLKEYYNSLNTLFENYKTTITYNCTAPCPP